MNQLDNIKNLPDLEYLRSFVVFVEENNIVKAAQQLKISQPLLSQHLQRLEAHWGISLFQFQGRKKVLTQLGELLYTLVSEHLRRLSTEVRSTLVLGATRRQLRIGGRKEVLSEVIGRLQLDGRLLFLPMGSQEVEEGLRSRNLEIGLSQMNIDSSSLIRKKLWADEFALCWSPKLKISDNQKMDSLLMQLENHQCFDYGTRSQLHRIREKYRLSEMPEKVTEFPDWAILKNLMIQHAGWGILPSQFVREAGKDLLSVALPAPFNDKVQFYLYFQKELAKLPWFPQFLAQLQ